MPSSAATFVAVVIERDHSSEDALSTVRALDAEPDVSVRDAVVVERTNLGRIELQQTRQIAPGESIVGGGTAGLVAGLLLGAPVGGALVGLVGGALFGMRDTGIPNKRLRKLGEDLQPGQAMLCVLVNATAVARTHEALQRYGATFEVDLSSRSAP